MSATGCTVANTSADNSDYFATFANNKVTNATHFAQGMDMGVAALPTVTKVTLLPKEADGEVVFVPGDGDHAVWDTDDLEEAEIASVIEAEEFQTIAVTWPSDIEDPEPMQIQVRDAETGEWGDPITLEPDLTGPEEALEDPQLLRAWAANRFG